MPTHRLEFAWGTDTGRLRAGNEDAVAVYPDSGLVIIADGIGGASAGEVASHLAVQAVNDYFHDGNGLPVDGNEALRQVEEAVGAANLVIWESAQETRRYAGMGTTLVVGYACADRLIFAHVGDSRLSCLRDGELVQLTRDHSLIQDVVEQGLFPSLDEARSYGINENILTRALGTATPAQVDTGDQDLRSGDLYLFCTDGLTGMVTDTGLRRVLLTAGDDLDSVSRALIELACDTAGVWTTSPLP